MSAYTINTVCLAGGRLTRDAELKYINNGSAVVTFSVAVGRSVKVGDNLWEEKTDFFKVVYWGKQAEAVYQFLLRGRRVAINGRLSQNRWTERGTGKNRSTVEVVAEKVIVFFEPKNENSGEGNSEYSQEENNYSEQPRQQSAVPVPQQEYQQKHYQQPPPAGQQCTYEQQPPSGGYEQPNMQDKLNDEDVPF